MQIVKIISFALIGVFLAFGISHIYEFGYLVPWVKVTSPLENVQEYFIEKDNHQNPQGSLIITNPCDISQPKFSIISSAPQKITKCVQFTTLYAEGESRNTYVLDEKGNVWKWSHLNYVDLGELAGLLLVGILIGVWCGLLFIQERLSRIVRFLMREQREARSGYVQGVFCGVREYMQG